MQNENRNMQRKWIVPKDGSEPYVERGGQVFTKSQIIALIESYGYSKTYAEFLAEKFWFDFFLDMMKRVFHSGVVRRLQENGKNKWVIPKHGEAPYMIVQGQKKPYMEMIDDLRRMGFRMQLAIEEVENGRYEEAVYEQYHRLVEDPIGSYREAMAKFY